MGNTKSYVNLLAGLLAAIGSFTYGYSASIMGGTLSKPEFYIYMELAITGPGASHANSLIAAFNLLFYAGGLIGICFYPYLSHRFGRRVPLAIGAAINILGGALSAGEINAGMLCVGRTFSGLGVGLILPGIPLYQAEISPPHSRGIMVGLHACLLGAGMSVAQWMGVAFFHVGGPLGSQVSWRVPMALQCLWPLILIALIWLLPESPRWLYLNGRSADSQKILIKLHNDSADPEHSFARNEFDLMKAQIDLEAEETQNISRIWTNPHLRKRFTIGFLVMSGTQSSGAIIILTYSAIIFGTLGFSSFMIGVMTGIWTVLLAIGNISGGWLCDHIGRKRQMLIGYYGCLFCLVMAAIMTKLYAATTNRAGNSAAAFFFFLFVIFYSAGVETGAWVYTSEVFPAAWRASGVAFSTSAVFFWSIIFTGVAPAAFANIGWKFYIVFICWTFAMIVLVTFFLPETKGYSLEQVSAAFGDRVVNEKILGDDVSEVGAMPSTDGEKLASNSIRPAATEVENV